MYMLQDKPKTVLTFSELLSRFAKESVSGQE